MNTPGSKFRQALAQEKPLQLVGTINAYTAIMAKKAGYKAIYLSGAGVANASYGLPDLGMTNLKDVLEDVVRITSSCDLPLLVDADTGWGNALNITRTVQQLIKAGAAGLHIEDQVQAKRCGHRPGKEIVEPQEMVDRIKTAVAAKTDPHFVIMARSDALATEGLPATIDRFKAYVAAGAEMIFAEAVTELSQYKAITQAIKVPVLANITEFGKTPLFTVRELADQDISIVLYPLSAFRAMNKAALKMYKTIRETGTQKSLLDQMQTREELYEFLNYHHYEDLMDRILKNKGKT
jgi:methylisocitrate lyase